MNIESADRKMKYLYNSTTSRPSALLIDLDRKSYFAILQNKFNTILHDSKTYQNASLFSILAENK